MHTEPEHHDHPKPTEPLRPLQYERQLAWPWSLGQTDPVKLQKFARRAAMFRRIGCLTAVLLAAAIFVFIAYVVRNGRI
jgi:hypothetical protein